MKVESEQKSSQSSFSPTLEPSEAYPPQIFLNWSITNSSVSGAGYFPALLTANQQLQIQTVNDEFLFLLDYQEENELLGKSALLLGPSQKELTTPGERFTAIKKKNGDFVSGFLKIKSRNDIVIINFQQIAVQQCNFALAQDNKIIEIENPSFFEDIEPPLLVDHVLPLFQPSCEKQYLTLRKTFTCWPIQISSDKDNKYTMVTFPSIGGLLVASRDDLMITSINDDFSKAILGYSEAELIGKDVLSILPNIRDCLKKMSWIPVSNMVVSPTTSMAKKEMFCTKIPHSLDLFHKDGGVFKISVQCRNFEFEGNNFLAVWLGYHRDVESDVENVFSPTLVLGRKKSYHDALNTIVLKSRKPTKFPEIVLQSKKLGIQDFDEIKSLGEGAFSFIKLCAHKEDPSKIPIVIKYVVRSRILTWTRDYQEIGPRIPVELAVLHDLRRNPHQHTPSLQAHFSDDFYYCLLFDHYPAFDLFELLERKSELSLNEIRSIMKQTCSAINHLHSLGIVHRDVKDENILIDNNGHITLIDFGSAHYIEKGPFLTFYGTKLFCAPEILQGHPYEGRPQDVWQLGCLLYILIFRQNPFYSVEDILNCNINYSFPLDELLSDLFKNVLQENENIRFTVADILSHQWMAINE